MNLILTAAMEISVKLGLDLRMFLASIRLSIGWRSSVTLYSLVPFIVSVNNLPSSTHVTRDHDTNRLVSVGFVLFSWMRSVVTKILVLEVKFVHDF
jgi:hypothetical protein